MAASFSQSFQVDHSAFESQTLLPTFFSWEKETSSRRKGQTGPVQIARKTDGTGHNPNKDRWVRSKQQRSFATVSILMTPIVTWSVPKDMQ
jgi:hypothetical protein